MTQGLAARVEALLLGDAERRRLLSIVASLDLPDGWIGAGFVRDAVWDMLHGAAPQPITGDIDVIWFDRDSAPGRDSRIEQALAELAPGYRWEATNQAHVHAANGDPPYADATDAMRFWPETATAIAARMTGPERCEIAAPLGLRDLFDLALRPTPGFSLRKRHIFESRIARKRWLERYPLLHVEA